MNIDLYRFSYRNGSGPLQVVATNGPVTMVFDVVRTGLQYSPWGSTYTLEYEHLPAVALAATRWHRRQTTE